MSGIRTFIYKVQNAVAKIVEPKNDGELIPYGVKNTLPQEIITVIDDSGTATSCVDTLTTFIYADGFKDKTLSQKVINTKGQTFDSLLLDVSANVAMFEGFALLVIFNKDGEPIMLENIPFETIRKKTGGGFVVNPKFGTKDYKKDDNLELREFHPNELPASRAERIQNVLKENKPYPGEVLYIFQKRPGKNIYPVPKYYSAIEDLLSDAGLVKLENRNINDGFRPAVILTTVGRMDATTKGEDGKTEADRFDAAIEQFIGPEAAPVFHVETDTNEGKPNVTVFPLGEMLDGVDKARDRVPNAICRHFKVQPVLIGLKTSEGLGNQQAIKNSMKLQTLTVVKPQSMISEGFKRVFPQNDFTITTLDVFGDEVSTTEPTQTEPKPQP